MKYLLLALLLLAPTANAQYSLIGAADTAVVDLATGATVLSETLVSGSQVLATVHLGDDTNGLTAGATTFTAHLEYDNTPFGMAVQVGPTITWVKGSSLASVVELGPFLAESGVYRVVVSSDDALDTTIYSFARFLDTDPALGAAIAAVPTTAQINTEVDTGLNDYAGLKRTEATTDKNEILAAERGTDSGLLASGYTAPLDATATQLAVSTELGIYDGPTRAEATSDKDEILAVSGAISSGAITLKGTLSSKNFDGKDYVEVVQGEEKILTFIVEPATGLFAAATPTAISLTFKDPAGTKVELTDSDVTRITGVNDLQVFRVTLTTIQTQSLAAGIAGIEVTIDNQKAQFLDTLRIVESF